VEGNKKLIERETLEGRAEKKTEDERKFIYTSMSVNIVECSREKIVNEGWKLFRKIKKKLNFFLSFMKFKAFLFFFYNFLGVQLLCHP
jgi:hypothetical protein